MEKKESYKHRFADRKKRERLPKNIIEIKNFDVKINTNKPTINDMIEMELRYATFLVNKMERMYEYKNINYRVYEYERMCLSYMMSRNMGERELKFNSGNYQKFMLNEINRQRNGNGKIQ